MLSIQIFPEDLANALKIKNIFVIDPVRETEKLEVTIIDSLSKPELSVIIARRPCLLAAKRINDFEKTHGIKQNE